ncbi:DNA primase large subunit [Coccomyxa sp. Obi]|nr:DNA primase large subunit [Coccomyxa sp. Obi]
MSAWMQKQQARTIKPAVDESSEVVTQYRISLYKEPPSGEVCIEEFERFAIDRLRVLKGIEDAKTKGFKGDQLHGLVVQLAEKHLKCLTAEETRWKDAVSHFVLRLAYCRTEELRRWFLQQECELFRSRFKNEIPTSQVEFMKRHSFAYEALAGEEYEALRPDLVKVQESIGNIAFAAELKQSASRDAFFKVPFEQVPDLVSSRRVLLRGGWAFVSRQQVASLVVGHFRAGLSHSLAITARRWAAAIADEEAERLTPIVLSLSERYLGPDYGDGERKSPQDVVTAAQIPFLAKQSFPLCMQNMYNRLHSDAHLKHWGRMQLGLFLKGIGLPLEGALKFWRAEFAPKTTAEKFDKEYAYNVRHNYAKEGKRTDYTPYSCLKIISTPVPKGDAFGCPYVTLAPAELAEQLQAMRLPAETVKDAVAKARGKHYQLACMAVFEGQHTCICDSGINHPNQYYDESRKVLLEQQDAAATVPVPEQKNPAVGAAKTADVSGSLQHTPAADARTAATGSTA